MSSSINLPWYVPQSNPPKDRLTFGVEIEFVLASLPADKQDHNPEDARTAYGISGDFSGAQVNLTDPQGKNNIDTEALHEHARNHIAKTFTAAGILCEVEPASFISDPWEFGQWHPKDPRSRVVTHESDVLDPDNTPEEYRWHPIELNSPPLYYSPEVVQHVMNVVSLVTESYRCVLIKRTDLYIHVGNSTEGFSAETIRKLAATYLTFEPEIEQIHPYYSIDNLIAASLRRGSELAGNYIIPSESRNNAGFLHYLFLEENCTLDAFKRAVSSQKIVEDRSSLRGALNFSNLSSDTGKSKNTVEFRQHTGTLDPQRVAHWLRLCVGLLEFSDTVEKATLVPFLEEHIDHDVQEFGLDKALQALGLPREAKYYGDFLEKITGERNSFGEWLGNLKG